MTREEFITILDDNKYLHKIVDDKIVVTEGDKYVHVNLGSLETLPSGVEFNNGGYVDLELLETLPSGVEFNNEGSVYLTLLKTLPSDVEFNNVGNIDLAALKTLPYDVEFKNEGDVWLESLIGGYFHNWKGNIEGINSKRLLNVMIKRGLFL